MMNTFTKDTDIEVLLKLPLMELVSYANKVRQDFIEPKMDLCSIINAKSGRCEQDCKFCAQSAHHRADISIYSLKSKDKIVKAAVRTKEIGAKKFGIVTSGNTLNDEELDVVVSAIKEISAKYGISVCASLGALNHSQLQLLKNAGLSRYHHNIETSPQFYSQIVSTHSFEERVNTIKSAKSAGLEVCSGGIIGMGEGWQDRIEMAKLLKELDIDSVPINILVPIKGTPFESLKPISANDIIRTISIFRIILKDKAIKIAAGRESALKDFQALAFMAGANGMLIGGYLTLKGREIDADKILAKEVEEIWKK